MDAKVAELQLRIIELEKLNAKQNEMIEKHEKILQTFSMIISGKKVKSKREKVVCPPAGDKVIRFGSTSDKDYGFMSLFYKAPFTLDGFEWQTLMHYIAAGKFLKTDPEYAEVIRTTENSAMARSKGLNKSKKADEDYNVLDSLKRGLIAKFEQNDDLAEKLINTDEEKMFEYENAKDNIFGIGSDGKGENHFGKLLFETRKHLLEMVEVDSDDE
jgi:ribA/ribD-fused uncharacterized protein